MQNFITVLTSVAGLWISVSAIAVPDAIASVESVESAERPFGLIPYPFAFKDMDENNSTVIPADWQTADPEILALKKAGKNFDLADATFAQARPSDETCACSGSGGSAADTSPVNSVLDKRAQYPRVCWNWCCDASRFRIREGIQYLNGVGQLCQNSGTKFRVSCSWSAGIFLENASGGRRCTTGKQVAAMAKAIHDSCHRGGVAGFDYTNGYVRIDGAPAGWWVVVHASNC